MAPELIKSKGGNYEYGTTVDIWSLGIFSLELALGKPPNLKEHDESKMYFKILLSDTPKIPSKWSKSFQDFIDKCLIKNENERWTVN